MMQNNELDLRPSAIPALFKAAPFIILALLMAVLAWQLSPYFMVFGLAAMFVAWYRFLALRCCRYLITPGFIRIDRGLLFKRTDQVEMFRIRDYIILRPPLFRWFGLIDLVLKGTDPGNPMIVLQGIPASDITDTIREYVLAARKVNNILESN